MLLVGIMGIKKAGDNLRLFEMQAKA